MRIIKFRAKRPDDGKWVVGDLKHYQRVTPTGLEPAILVDNDPVIVETIGQFTGLPDKNGREIYEGDVIKTDQNKILGVIKWDEHRLCFLCEWTNMPTAGDVEYLINNCGLEIIGNIHDNPELLKGGKE